MVARDVGLLCVAAYGKWLEAPYVPLPTSSSLIPQSIGVVTCYTTDESIRGNGGGGRSACYVLFTSGSTGTPKGVVLEHANSCHFVSLVGSIDRVVLPRVAIFALSFIFDGHVRSVYPILYFGSTLVVFTKVQLYGNFNDIISDNCANSVVVTPSGLSTLTKLPKNTSLDVVHLGGEIVTNGLRLLWSGALTHLFNGYGPTETSVHVSYVRYRVNENVHHETIGGPQKNVQCSSSTTCPTELVVHGKQTARQYLRRPVQSAQKFNVYRKSYSTGDLVRFLPDGSLGFMGRLDCQVKLRGFRI